ncbi:hypothetical protein TNCV_681861 [Trichonephila clavipes]|nr:hypothetical protein TNCV_681861 [Trichonephila clavipes]
MNDGRFLTDTIDTQEPMEEETTRRNAIRRTWCHMHALDLALRYLEKQLDTTPDDVLFMRRWRNYASMENYLIR